MAKRYESDLVDEVDLAMSFEELVDSLAVYNIDAAGCEELPLNSKITKFAQGYAQSGGVRDAIVNAVGEEYTTFSEEGLDKQNKRLLKGMVKKT